MLEGTRSAAADTWPSDFDGGSYLRRGMRDARIRHRAKGSAETTAPHCCCFPMPINGARSPSGISHDRGPLARGRSAQISSHRRQLRRAAFAPPAFRAATSRSKSACSEAACT
ncbi:hypothetical protein HPB50_010708 [Hyalomma asiaticum]|uniref:Uncharacterized protein n=1 Tax=Hyalomma asiaticum TaxID=266040 RepID=A0ACB7SCP1_HYAAI|nr:hypothetical protein HPB50_010708 [Hyalomma asiaticum]